VHALGGRFFVLKKGPLGQKLMLVDELEAILQVVPYVDKELKGRARSQSSPLSSKEQGTTTDESDIDLQSEDDGTTSEGVYRIGTEASGSVVRSFQERLYEYFFQ
jgi:hypothetical protein